MQMRNHQPCAALALFTKSVARSCASPRALAIAQRLGAVKSPRTGNPHALRRHTHTRFIPPNGKHHDPARRCARCTTASRCRSHLPPTPSIPTAITTKSFRDAAMSAVGGHAVAAAPASSQPASQPTRQGILLTFSAVAVAEGAPGWRSEGRSSSSYTAAAVAPSRCSRQQPTPRSRCH